MGLEYIYAALLLHETKQNITEDSIFKVVEATGVKPDKAMVKATVENLKDVNIDEVLKSAVTVPTAAAPVAQPEAPKEEEKKKSEEEKEKKAEEAAAGLSSLFG